MTIMFLRRRRLGMGSVRGFKHWGNQLHGYNTVDWVRNDQMDRKNWNNVTHVVRWGCTSTVPRVNGERIPVINKASAIHATSDKAGFRKSFESMFSIPSFGDGWGDPVFPCVVRPYTHSRGRDLYFCNDQRELDSAILQCGPNWYAGEYIPKVEEYRVYVVGGRAVAVARKNVEDKEAVAWNRALGGCEFSNVKWGEWPLMVVKAGLEAVNHLGLDFGGADVMVDKEGKPYVLEVNSAPSHPLLDVESGFGRNTPNDIGARASYNQKCFVNGLLHTIKHGPVAVTSINSWKDVIHPGVSDKARVVAHDE